MGVGMSMIGDVSGVVHVMNIQCRPQGVSE